MLRSCRTALLIFAALGTICSVARAEVTEVRLAQQFSMGYMQFAIMERNRLIEKHAMAAGLGEIKVFWDRFNGPNFTNDALMSGAGDISSVFKKKPASWKDLFFPEIHGLQGS